MLRNKDRLINLSELVLSILGLILLIIGCFLSPATSVGFNLNPLGNGLVIAGLVIIFVSLLASIASKVTLWAIKIENDFGILNIEVISTILISALVFLVIFCSWAFLTGH